MVGLSNFFCPYSDVKSMFVPELGSLIFCVRSSFLFTISVVQHFNMNKAKTEHKWTPVHSRVYTEDPIECDKQKQDVIAVQLALH